MDVGRSWGRNIAAAMRMAGHILTGPLWQPYRRSWGATPEEVAASWPGDELLPHPSWTVTHAITIHAPTEKVWSWLAQIGQGRGGLYSFERLENLIGCQMRNTDRILPEHQDLSQVVEIRLAPQATLTLSHVEPGQDLVLVASPGSSTEQQRVTGGRWSFHLRPTGRGSTRLVERLSFSAGSTWQEKLFTSPKLIEPISFVMSQEMLRNIQRLVERTTHVPTQPARSPRLTHQRWKDLTSWQQTTVLVLASIQLSLAATAWADLAIRPANQLNGSKGVWATIIAVNFLGPALYLTWGVRHQP